jgi:hypothetical protein
MQQPPQPLFCEALIVDPDAKWRGTLRAAAQTLTTFSDIKQASSCREARRILDSRPDCDIVFFSFRVPEAEMNAFVQEARRRAGGDEVTFVSIVPQPTDGGGDAATLLLQGMNGILFEPYSVQAIQELSEVVLTTKKQRLIERRRAAMRLVINEITQLIDQRALMIKRSRPSDVPTARIKKLMVPVHSMPPEEQQTFFELVEEEFCAVPPPQGISYAGVSERVRKKLEAKREKEEEQLMKSGR